jgi:hypothetical protein
MRERTGAKEWDDETRGGCVKRYTRKKNIKMAKLFNFDFPLGSTLFTIFAAHVSKIVP